MARVSFRSGLNVQSREHFRTANNNARRVPAAPVWAPSGCGSFNVTEQSLSSTGLEMTKTFHSRIALACFELIQARLIRPAGGLE